jgi:hypothetical protein
MAIKAENPIANEEEQAEVQAGGAKKPRACPQCTDPLRGHPKPLCSQLLRNKVTVLGALNAGRLTVPPDNQLEGEDNTSLISPSDVPALSRAFAGEAPLTPAAVRESIRVAFAHRTLSAAPEYFFNYLDNQGQSISTWRSAARAAQADEVAVPCNATQAAGDDHDSDSVEEAGSADSESVRPEPEELTASASARLEGNSESDDHDNPSHEGLEIPGRRGHGILSTFTRYSISLLVVTTL